MFFSSQSFQQIVINTHESLWCGELLRTYIQEDSSSMEEDAITSMKLTDTLSGLTNYCCFLVCRYFNICNSVLFGKSERISFPNQKELMKLWESCCLWTLKLLKSYGKLSYSNCFPAFPLSFRFHEIKFESFFICFEETNII